MLLGWYTSSIFASFLAAANSNREAGLDVKHLFLIFIFSDDDADRWILVYSSPLCGGVRFFTTLSDSLGLYLLHFAQ